ncbi:MAG: ParB N-terminal domain-containing protein [Deltaproteobacteria bacterium]|nr:ParB N-terminal domain-containing protein [Deltaproteobacteria bacterium]
MKVEEIPISDIIIPEERARATFSPEQNEELRASIEKNGFTVPILVRALDDGKYELIDGEHRIQVVSELGWDKIPAVVSELDDTRATLLNILANTARGSQNPMDGRGGSVEEGVRGGGGRKGACSGDGTHRKLGSAVFSANRPP